MRVSRSNVFIQRAYITPPFLLFKKGQLPLSPSPDHIIEFSSKQSRRSVAERWRVAHLISDWKQARLDVVDRTILVFSESENNVCAGMLMNTKLLEGGPSVWPYDGGLARLYLYAHLDAALRAKAVKRYEELQSLSSSTGMDLDRGLIGERLPIAWRTLFQINLDMLSRLSSDGSVVNFGSWDPEKIGKALCFLGFPNPMTPIGLTTHERVISSLSDILSRNGFDRYRGNRNQIKLAEAAGVKSLSGMFKVLAFLGHDKELQYVNLEIATSSVMFLLELEKGEKWKQYAGDINLPRLAEYLGIKDLGRLFRTVKLLGLNDKLGYTWMSVPASKVNMLPLTLYEAYKPVEPETKRVEPEISVAKVDEAPRKKMQKPKVEKVPEKNPANPSLSVVDIRKFIKGPDSVRARIFIVALGDRKQKELLAACVGDHVAIPPALFKRFYEDNDKNRMAALFMASTPEQKRLIFNSIDDKTLTMLLIQLTSMSMEKCLKCLAVDEGFAGRIAVALNYVRTSQSSETHGLLRDALLRTFPAQLSGVI